MLLQVTHAITSIPTLGFTFTVPGDQQWTLRSVRAIAQIAVGGSPNRAYTLAITDGLNVVALVGAADAGTEPGTCTITWANTPAASVAAGNVGVSVAPLTNVALPPGYLITGAIIGAAAGDSWLDVIAWYDFTYTSTP